MGAASSVQDYASRLNAVEMAALMAESEDKVRNYLHENGINDDDEIAKIMSYFSVSHKNSAFLFIKPHANNEAVQALVNKALADNNLSIVSEGEIQAEVIDSQQLIDNHYYSIASKATLLQPKDLPIPVDKFEAFFGESFESALANESVFNALDACKYLEVEGTDLESIWRRAQNKTIKFGGGFYCAKIDDVEGKKPIYILNGFFMSMRSTFVIPGTSIHYYVVEWDPIASGINWAKFRDEIIGATDPSKSIDSSIRGIIYKDWESLNLTEQPGGSKNGVHGSASPFEGLAEKCNWLGVDPADDPFGAGLIQGGWSGGDAAIPKPLLLTWFKDPQISTDDYTGSAFDFFENADVDDCYIKANLIKK